MTGKDTSENFRLLFGVDDIPDIHAETRTAVLAMESVAEGSPAHRLNGFLDQGCPAFAPRPASDAEKTMAKQLEVGAMFQSFMPR